MTFKRVISLFVLLSDETTPTSRKRGIEVIIWMIAYSDASGIQLNFKIICVAWYFLCVTLGKALSKNNQQTRVYNFRGY